MIGLIGERGVGKTTLMLQRLKEHPEGGFYFSADNTLIAAEGLFTFVYHLYFDLQVSTVYIDEIHKYAHRTTEIKNIYDSMPTINVVFSGSSSLDLYKGVLDLARRASFWTIYPMSYKEYLKFFHQVEIPDFTVEEILQNHERISSEYGHLHRQTWFQDFINRGQYPYTKDIQSFSYVLKFQNLFDKVILEDIPVFVNLQTASLDKLRRLLYFIANSTPSELSFLSLSRKI